MGRNYRKLQAQAESNVTRKLRELDIAVDEQCRLLGREPCKCLTCDRIFMDNLTLELHHCGRRPVWACSVCSDSFSNEVDLADHLKKHEEEYQRCPACPEGFHKGRGLWKHFSSVHPTETFPESPRGATPKGSHPWGNRPEWKCSICSAVFYREAQLADHLKKHEEVEICLFCPKRYRTPRGLRVHIGKAHPEEAQRSKACSFCSRSYETWSGLNAHIRRAHPEIHRGGEDPETNKGRATVVERQICFRETQRGSLMQQIQLDHPDQCSSMDSVNDHTSSPGQVQAGIEITTNLLPRTVNRQHLSGYLDKCAIDYVLNGNPSAPAEETG